MQIEQFEYKYHSMHIWLWWKLQILLNTYKFWETLEASSRLGSLGRMLNILKSVPQVRDEAGFFLELQLQWGEVFM